MFETLEQWDSELFVFLNSLGIEQFDGFWIFATKIESWTLLFGFFIFLIFYYYKGKKGVLVFSFGLCTFLITLLFTELTKDFIARLRPNNVAEFSGLIRILQSPNSYSFFSGHASSSFAITTFLVLVLRNFNKWIFLAYLWPLVFSLSRIYVGVHYPGDILVGALVGTGFAIISYKLYRTAEFKIFQKASY